MSGQSTLLTASGPTLCEGCHEDVVHAARAETGHWPAGDDCITCHQPHSADQPKLLNAPAGELCRTCHDVDDEALRATHLEADLDRLDCLSCHSPHGTGNPKSLAKNLHPPLLDGCDTCHEGRADQVMENGESSLCLVCHDDIGEVAAQAQFPHGALEMARCADCHNPHASAQASLVAAPGGAVCQVCHEDQIAGEGEVAHGVIDLIGCQACHEPHGGSRPKLLRSEGAELCLSCHDSARVDVSSGAESVKLLDRFGVTAEEAARTAVLSLTGDGQHGHPMKNHRVLGAPTADELKNTETTFNGEFTCLTCHDPHKGASSRILRWGATSATEACLQCHTGK